MIDLARQITVGIVCGVAIFVVILIILIFLYLYDGHHRKHL